MTSPYPPGSLLDALRPATRECLLTLGGRRRLPTGEVLIHQGDEPADVVLILDGYVKVTAVTEVGRQAFLALRGQGDLVGEIGVLDGGRRTARVTAVGTVVVRIISGSEFRAFVERYPDAGAAVTAVVADKLRSAIQRRLEFSDGSVRSRLARVLLEFAVQWGREVPEGVLISVGLSQAELAGAVGAVERSVHEALTEFRELKLLDVGYRRIVVKDMQALSTIAYE